MMPESYRSLEWIPPHTLRLLDQRVLPYEERWLDLNDYRQLAERIADLTVRGAPAIGAAAAYGLALAAFHAPAGDLPGLRAVLEDAARTLKAARPTAVNLAWAVDRLLAAEAVTAAASPAALQAALLAEAHAVAAEDAHANRRIGRHALALWGLIGDGSSDAAEPLTFIHHCNTGALATVAYGTALGVIRAAHESGRHVFVYVDETRPRLQGARLTAWELGRLGIPHAVIVDGASGHIMRTRRVHACLVGADRIAANGDTANKIGTYNLALAAGAHAVPFYVAAPTSTIDLALPSGDLIPIEERAAVEITHIEGAPLAAPGSPAYNPAFDVTPAACISAILTEAGIARPPYTRSLAQMVQAARG
jgi:methylthioribose-1-phosphate isomerase